MSSGKDGPISFGVDAKVPRCWKVDVIIYGVGEDLYSGVVKFEAASEMAVAGAVVNLADNPGQGSFFCFFGRQGG
ncbi:MAG: hypothetical protein ABIG61_09710 [Planctomycetota bacterium]